MKQNICLLLQTPVVRPSNRSLQTTSTSNSQQSLNQPNPLAALITNTKISLCDILSPDIIKSYHLNSNLLGHSVIKEFHRAKIRLWLAENCYSRKLSSQTVSLACYILDLFFAKGNSCSIQDLDQFAICCLRIAAKLLDCIQIPINYTIFDNKKLQEIESQICFKINFQLNPLTFTDLALCLNYLWSVYKDTVNENMFSGADTFLNTLSCQLKAKIAQLDLAFVLLNELLEFLHLFLDTFQFVLDSLVFNCFYLIFCLQFNRWQKLLPPSMVEQFAKGSNETRKVIDQFTIFCRALNYNLDLEVDAKCLSYVHSIYNLLVLGDADRNTWRNFTFNPNEPSLRMKAGDLRHSLHFKNKWFSFKKYSRRASNSSSGKRTHE